MRDTERIDSLLAEVREFWKKNPDLRFGQIMMILYPETAFPSLEAWKTSLWNAEDDVFLERLRSLK